MADVQVNLKLPVLRLGSAPESGPTVIEHQAGRLSDRKCGWRLRTVHRPISQTLSAERKSHGRRDCRKTDLDIPPVQMAAAVGTKLNG